MKSWDVTVWQTENFYCSEDQLSKSSRASGVFQLARLCQAKIGLRELSEETGLSLEKDNFDFTGTLYVRYPDYDYIYHRYIVRLPQVALISLDSREHDDYAWVTRDEALEKDLMMDLPEDLRLFLL